MHRLFSPLRHSGRAARRLRRLCGLPFAALALLLPLHAASADETAPSAVSMPSAKLRLVAEPAAGTSEVRAALLIDLEPGWKTYWLDPGEAGIPPRLDLGASTNIVAAETAFPLPHRTNDPTGASNVYSQPLAVALTLRRPDAALPSAIDLGLTLGLCREVCIPVATRLRLDLREAAPADARLVAYAFDALPERSTPTAGVQSARLAGDGRTIEVEALAPNDRAAPNADLFLAGEDGWFFGRPAAPRRDGRRLVFSVPVTGRPSSAGSLPPAKVDALLLLGAHAYRVDSLSVSASR